MTEAGEVNRDEVGVLTELRPRCLEGEQALRLGAQKEGMLAHTRVLAFREADGEPINCPVLGPYRNLNLSIHLVAPSFL